MIEINNVVKKFKISKKQRRELELPKDKKSVEAVNNISFCCKPGRVFTLLGPNGAGKTTLLRMIATMLKPDSGTIQISGFDTVNNSREVRKKIGFLTGSTKLYKQFTPEEIIKYFAFLHGMTNEEFCVAKKKLYSILGMKDFVNKKIDKLSSGMIQKVSIARTLIHDPEVLIFDEPTVGLDVISSKSIIKLIKEYRDRGKTIIFSTHIMGEVNFLSDDLAIIHKGKIQYADSFENFLHQKETRTIEDEFLRLLGEGK